MNAGSRVTCRFIFTNAGNARCVKSLSRTRHDIWLRVQLGNLPRWQKSPVRNATFGCTLVHYSAIWLECTPTRLRSTGSDLPIPIAFARGGLTDAAFSTLIQRRYNFQLLHNSVLTIENEYSFHF